MSDVSSSPPREGELRYEAPWHFPTAAWREVARRVVEETQSDRVFSEAGGIAFFFLLSIPPTIGLLVSLFALFMDPSRVESFVLGVGPLLPENARDLFAQLVQSVVHRSDTVHGLGFVVALVAAVWAATSGTAMLIESVNAAYDEPETRSLLAQRWLAMKYTAAVVVFGVVTIGLTAILPLALHFVGLGEYQSQLVRHLRWPLLVVTFFVGVSVTYRSAPDRAKPRWPWVVIGSLVAMALWLVGSFGFAYYVDHVGNYDRIYGSIASVVVFMLWLYLTAVAVLLGAEVNSELELQTTCDTTVGPERPLGERGATKADALPPPPMSPATRSRPWRRFRAYWRSHTHPS